jgi:HPt (histidine-containing phosphotransfer) domain-containing protein
VRKFIEQFPAKLVAMDEALAQHNLAELALLAHWLKGAGGSVGFDDFFEPARELEQACKDDNAVQAARHMQAVHALSRRMTLDAPDTAEAAT